MYAYCRIQKHESSPPPDLHPLSFFFLDNTNPADVHVIRHAWRICCSIYETFRSTVMIIYTAKKIYITRRRGLCYIIIFLQSYSYLHTALLKWRLTTDSISENGGGGGFLPTPWIYRRHLPHSMFMFVFRNNVLLKIINIWFLFCSSIQVFFFFYFWFMNSHITFRKAICWCGL